MATSARRNRRQKARALALSLIRKSGGSVSGSAPRAVLVQKLKQIGVCPQNISGLAEFYTHWKREQLPFEPDPVKTKTKAKAKKLPPAKSDDFLSSWEWTTLRYSVLKKHGRRCMVCGRTPDDGIKIHVDHIKPRHTHPELALAEDNLQVLCADCNKGKGAWDDTDWRRSADGPA